MRPSLHAQLARVLFAALLSFPILAGAQERPRGAVAGLVRAEDGSPLADATVALIAAGGTQARETTTDPEGRFRLGDVAPGLHDLTVRRLGFRVATLRELRVVPGRTAEVTVLLARSETRLSQVVVVSLPTTIDATTPALAIRLDRAVTALLPTARDAASLVSLVPGARADQVWGGGGMLANNVQLDGMAVNHPGIGGDFLRPSVDWIETMDVRGLGAGAADGNFQGGIVDAITRTGTNTRTLALRSLYDSPNLSASNFNLQEDGAEQAGRLELGGEASGPVRADRLFYFAGAQYVARDIRVPDLSSDGSEDYADAQTEERTLRGMGKLTWLPSAGARVDALLGFAHVRTERYALTGYDDPAAAQSVEAPSLFWATTWFQPLGGTKSLSLRATGFHGAEEREGVEGPAIPGLHVVSPGREPAYQNPAFTDRLDPSSVALKGTFGASHRWRWLGQSVQLGGEWVRGRWVRESTRNGGVTWRPYPDPLVGTIDPANTATWAAIGSEWGGDIALDATVDNASLFLEDAIRVGPHVTVTAGVRYGHWRGSFETANGSPELTASGWDPRIGISADLSGNNTLALKAHWGRYHQGMAASLVDRLAGVDAYANTRIYMQGPRFTDPRQVYTIAERDALFRNPDTGTAFGWTERVVNEGGPAEGYRQPYVDQLALGIEKNFGPRWKAEVFYVHRTNRDFVGLRDRNVATNYTLVRDLAVSHRLGLFPLQDPAGAPLVLPGVWVSNRDLRATLARLRNELRPPLPGFSFDTIASLTWDPDYVLGVIPEAERRYEQLSLVLRTTQSRWTALGSATWGRLEGNVAGVSGTGGTGASYTAGPWVRPNEAWNFDGPLPGLSDLELKLWASARLAWGIEGGINILHLTGETITPAFVMEPSRYRFTRENESRAFDTGAFASLEGQPIFLEPRGSRHYADRTTVDIRAERGFALRDSRLVVTADVFNLLGSDEATLVKTTVDDRFISTANERYGAVRLRVPPRTVRLGMRVELPSAR